MVRLTRELTCAVGVSLACGVDGFLANLALRFKATVFAAGAVPVTAQQETLIKSNVVINCRARSNEVAGPSQFLRTKD